MNSLEDCLGCRPLIESIMAKLTFAEGSNWEQIKDLMETTSASGHLTWQKENQGTPLETVLRAWLRRRHDCVLWDNLWKCCRDVARVAFKAICSLYSHRRSVSAFLAHSLAHSWYRLDFNMVLLCLWTSLQGAVVERNVSGLGTLGSSRFFLQMMWLCEHQLVTALCSRLDYFQQEYHTNLPGILITSQPSEPP